MKWILLRLAAGTALIYVFMLVNEMSLERGTEADLTHAFLMALAVMLCVVNAAVWAPYVGAKVAEPVTGMLTDGSFQERKFRWLRLLRWLDAKGCRRLTMCCCFIAGVKHPFLPTAFKIGLKNARPGGWWERIYAREVYRFGNARDCILAFHALKRHGVDPPLHTNPEINVVLQSLEREVKPTPDPLPVPPAPPVETLKRNTRIRLFSKSEDNLVVQPPSSAGEESSK